MMIYRLKMLMTEDFNYWTHSPITPSTSRFRQSLSHSVTDCDEQNEGKEYFSTKNEVLQIWFSRQDRGYGVRDIPSVLYVNIILKQTPITPDELPLLQAVASSDG